MVAMAASTADPPSFKILAPSSEHNVASDATTACLNDPGSGLGVGIGKIGVGMAVREVGVGLGVVELGAGLLEFVELCLPEPPLFLEFSSRTPKYSPPPMPAHNNRVAMRIMTSITLQRMDCSCFSSDRPVTEISGTTSALRLTSLFIFEHSVFLLGFV